MQQQHLIYNLQINNIGYSNEYTNTTSIWTTGPVNINTYFVACTMTLPFIGVYFIMWDGLFKANVQTSGNVLISLNSDSVDAGLSPLTRIITTNNTNINKIRVVTCTSVNMNVYGIMTAIDNNFACITSNYSYVRIA
jgi:hypothetical protein